MLRLGVPLVFVLIWSTGFIVAKAVLPHADLQLFLVARFSLLAPKLAGHGVGSLTPLPVAAALVSVFAVTTGTIVQKWLATTDLRTAASIQSFGAAIVAALAMLLIGTPLWDGTPILWGALALALGGVLMTRSARAPI